MPSMTQWLIRYAKRLQRTERRYLLNTLGVFLLLTLVCIEFASLNSTHVDAQSHTSPSVNGNCHNISYSPDGNPFPICPGPYPVGGNCTWWVWEQWHLLGYNLPLNWGNAADWIVDAERAGLPIGKTPRIGAIAIFPRGDGVWAYGPLGHVAFVTSVSADGTTFNVTYQNYGDPTPVYIGTGYNVSIINQSRFQHGDLRFIYFPQNIEFQHFARLPGIKNDDSSALLQANSMLNARTSSTTFTGDRIALGLPPVSTDQEFNADFTGTGFSDLLLYDRHQGRLEVLNLANTYAPQRASGKHPSGVVHDPSLATPANAQFVSLADAITPANGWGSSLDVHIGDFAGTGESDILLYDRATGILQLISLTPQLTIKKHVTLAGWGPGWELYIGRFDGTRSGVFMYKRYAEPDQTVIPTPIPTSDTTEVTPPAAFPSPTPRPTLPRPKPSPTAKPIVKPDPTAKPTAKADPTPKPSPTATPKPRPTVTASPTATPRPTVTVGPTGETKPYPTPTAKPKQGENLYIIDTSSTSTDGAGGGDLSGTAPEDWEKHGRTANVFVLDFNQDFSIREQQQYTLWHANWEVYIGRFASPGQDGVFLYDRSVGEGRIMDFDHKMFVADYQELHNLDGNWVVYSGDFAGSGRAQLLLYDPSSGKAQILLFDRKLALAGQKPYTDWGTNMVLYVGHFGMPTLSVMLYDPQVAQSTFIGFERSLKIAHKYTVQSWGQRWQILVGAFLDRSRCLSSGNCVTGDDILVLDRQSGQMAQFVFSFGRQFQVFDNRAQSFVRDGIAPETRLNAVDTTTFSLLTTLNTGVRNEELY